MSRTLLLLRGLPGSGKTTLARTLSPYNICADDYVTDQRGFQVAELQAAHKRCQEQVQKWIDEGVPLIVVHNTFVKQRDIDTYVSLAKDYRVSIVTVENRHNGVSVHNVPSETLAKMRQGFVVCL